MGRGIDYGPGQANIDPKNGIRYGVILANHLPWWYEISEPRYGEATCPKCGNPAEDIDEAPEDYGELEGWTDNGNDYCCTECQYTFESEEAFNGQPIGWAYEKEGYEVYQWGDDSDVFITASPYYTHAPLCSPCAPGACYLGYYASEVAFHAGGEKAYCPGHDWFEDNIAPYAVYRVTDDTLVPPG